MPDEQVVDTLPVDGAVDSQAAPPAGTPPSDAAEQYFLEADDRHKYRTKEDVIRAIQESGQTIGKLTPWQEHSQRYGVTDPSNLPKIFDQYLTMQKQLEKYQEAERAAQAQRDQGTRSAQLDPKDQQNVEYLEKHGFTRKEAIDKTLQEKLSPLENRLSGIEARFQETQAIQVNAVIDQGRSTLSTLMTDAGFPIDNAKFNEFVENNIVAWMEQNSRYDQQGQPLPGTLLHSFYQGGAAQKAVIEQGAKQVFEGLNHLRQQQDGTVQRQRQQQQVRTSRPLPKQGAPTPQDPKAQVPPAAPRPGAGGLFNKPEMHDKAWELLQERS